MTYDDLVPGDIIYDADKPTYPVWLMVRKDGGFASWLDLNQGLIVEDDPLGPAEVHSDYTIVLAEGR